MEMKFDELPVGFGMALARNFNAMNAYSAMTDQEKQEILNKAHNAHSAKEMSRIVNSLAAQ